MKFVKNSFGMGLVEVMMAVAVTGGLTLTIAKLMENSSQSAKQVEAKSENTNLKNLLLDTLGNPTACVNSLYGTMNATNVAALTAGTPTATVTFPNIKDKMNVIKYADTAVSTAFNISPLTITSISITNYNGPAGTGDLIVQSTFRKSSAIVMMVKPIRIPMNFAYTGTNLTACSTMAVGGEWLLGGNAGTNEASDFIGTSDDTPLNLRVNNQESGRIDRDGQTFFGYQAGMNQEPGNGGTAFGYHALRSNQSGLTNSAFGVQSLTANTMGESNAAFGYRSMMSSTNSTGNAAFGSETLRMNTDGERHVAIGQGALYSNTIGDENVAVGQRALYQNTTGSSNVAVGKDALTANTTGINNTAIGRSALQASTTTEKNVAIGYAALFSTTNGGWNVAIGPDSMRANISGENNIAVGYNSLFSNTNGTYNTALGDSAGYRNTTGNFNTFVGAVAGEDLGTGEYNIFLGGESGGEILSGNRNTILGGMAARDLTSGNNNIFLGYESGTGITTASNKLFIETNNFATPLIGGDFSSAGRYVSINGKLGIGTTTPVVALDVNGSIRPGSTGILAGGSCTGEGSFAYDLTAHAPVFCNQFGKWALMGSDFDSAHSFATNGYQKFSNGLIIQWGYSTAAYITFPIPFPGMCASVTVTTHRSTNGSSGYNHATNVSTTGFTPIKDAATAWWTAIGF